MGNHLFIFDDRTDYVKMEAGIGVGLLGLAIVGIVTLFFVYCCCCRKEKDNSKNNNTNSDSNCMDLCTLVDRCKNCCIDCCSSSCDCCIHEKYCTSCCNACKDFFTSANHLHRILGKVFPSISELYIKSEDVVTAKSENSANFQSEISANVKSKNNVYVKDTKTEPVFIISERELPSRDCIGFSTYLYFTYMLLMCCLWFITMLVEMMVYRKTGTCNDINVEVRSFSCFNVDNNSEIIDCENTPNIDEKNVICYLYRPNVGAFGVAFSTATLFSVIGDLAYNIILTGTKKFCRFFLLLRTLGLIVAVSGFIVFMVVAHIRWKTNYFIYAGIPMRYVQLLLLFATVVGILAFPPWKEYTDDEYNTKYRHLGYKDLEKGEKPKENLYSKLNEDETPGRETTPMSSHTADPKNSDDQNTLL